MLLVGGLTSYTLVKNGYFPVASVNGEVISYRTVKDNAEVSRRVYTQGLAGSSPEMDALFSRAGSKELIKSSLESLIANTIIKKTISPEIQSRADQEIKDNFKETASVANSVKNIYGWDIQTYKNRILEPQALLNVLSQEKGDGFDDWLKAEKTKTEVKIWFLPYRWEEGLLKNK